jgi:mono/diheme cytochrome c family protein
MSDQAKNKPFSKSDFFADGQSARPSVPGTVARGHLERGTLYLDGKTGDVFAAEIPMPVTPELLMRGQSRFNIYCTPCHGRTGEGNGMVVQRGYKQPPSYHIDRLRQAPPGYFFDVMTRGFATMPSYSYQVNPEDRWAIVAYVRALQLSQYAKVAELPQDLQSRVPAEEQ